MPNSRFKHAVRMALEEIRTARRAIDDAQEYRLLKMDRCHNIALRRARLALDSAKYWGEQMESHLLQ